MMKVTFADGVTARLVALSKSANYRLGFRVPPLDATLALTDIASKFIPMGWPPQQCQVTLLVSRGEIERLIEQRALPEVLVVAEFVAQVHDASGGRKTSFRRFAWLQQNLDDDISNDNRSRLADLSWRASQ